jgi:hypothetical protein
LFIADENDATPSTTSTSSSSSSEVKARVKMVSGGHGEAGVDESQVFVVSAIIFSDCIITGLCG